MDTIQVRNMSDRINSLSTVQDIREMSKNSRVRAEVLCARVAALHRQQETAHRAQERAAQR